MTDLTKIKTRELEAEIERRKQSHTFTVQGRSFTLNLEEIIDLQNQLNKINPPENPFDAVEGYRKALKNIPPREPWIQPPINPGWPKYPENPNHPYEPVKIWYGGETSPR